MLQRSECMGILNSWASKLVKSEAVRGVVFILDEDLNVSSSSAQKSISLFM